MSDRLRALRLDRGRKVTQMRAVLEAATGRDMTAEEQSQYEALDTEQEKLGAQITREERQTELEVGLAKVIEPGARLEPDPAKGNQGAGEKVAWNASPEYRAAYEQMLVHGQIDIGPKYRAALQADSQPAGGFLTMPEQMASTLIKAIDNEVFIRRLAHIERVTAAQSLGAPSLDADPADADWTSEIATGSEDSTMAFGKRELHPHPLAKRIKVSRKLLRLTGGGAEAIVRDRLAYKFGVSEEKSFLTGSGASQPLGVFTPSTSGISTARDVSTGSATAITADSLIDAKYNLKAGYQVNGVWVFHRDAVKQVRKLKDSQNQYLWQAGLSADQPDRILDRPFYMSEFAPNTFTTGKYVGIFGDFQYYWIAEAISMELQRLAELYAETNQIGFIGRQEVDGMPVLEEAFARLKTA